MRHRLATVAFLLAVASAALGQVIHTPSFPFNGDSALDRFGLSVSGAGDVNNDGFDDLIVGALDEDKNGVNTGSARVFSGADGSILYAFEGNAGGAFGASVSDAGDVNNDGFDDIIVGAPVDFINGFLSCSARVFSGADGSILFTFIGDSPTDVFGWSVSGAGDVNNDGFDDIIVGAYDDDNNGPNSGTARVFSGANGSILFTFDGDAISDNFGWSVSGAGDVNNDGFDDLIVGAPLDDNNGEDSGSARVFSGADGSILYTFSGYSTDDQFGYSVSGAGDVNNDGFDDLIVGAFREDGSNGMNAGSARVFSGATGDILYSFDGDSSGAQFGASVSGAGDVNNDGFSDIIVGAPNSTLGSASVFSGSDGSILSTFTGDSQGDLFGVSVSAAGDVNNDGFADFIVGAPFDDNNGTASGAAFLIRSAALPASPPPCPGDVTGDEVVNFADLNGVLSEFGSPCTEPAFLDEAIHTPSLPLNGDSAGDMLGDSLRGAGDVNNDGFDDFIVGAPGDDDNGANSGSARVYSGANGIVLYTFNGDSAGDGFGRSVSGAGDVNNDGFDDVIVGAPDDDNIAFNSGIARVFSGADGSILYTFNGAAALDQFGRSVSGAGDVNNDGFGDLIVGSRGANFGSARVFSGADGSVLHTFNGDSAGDNLGGSVSGAGDVNNDGFDDLIVGASGDDNNGADSGSARVFSGANGAILYTFNGDSASAFFGASVSGAGDVNNDGFDDLIIGAFGDDSAALNAGRARVFSGVNGAILHTFNGDSSGDQLGAAVSGAGDVNNDGFDDLIVGAFTDDNTASNAGSARIFSGLDGSILYTFDGDAASDQFGATVSGVGDLNNDGFADFIVGADGDDNNGDGSGGVFVFRSFALPGPCPGDLTGDNIVNFADLNGVLSNFGVPCPE
jgi:hypothetical protein